MKRFALLALSSLLACSTSAPSSSDACRGDMCEDSSQYMCAAIRGNGERILAHFGALARITEARGPVMGVSGGSSASITSFILESIYLNEQALLCGEDYCPQKERYARFALLIKSFQAYADLLMAELDPRAAGETALAAFADSLAHPQSPLPALLDENATEEQTTAAMEALLLLVSELSSEYPQLSLFNEGIADYLNASVAASDESISAEELASIKLALARDVVYGVKNLGSFETDPGMFLRPSLLDWHAFAELIGRAGNFYAGFGDVDFEPFLSACASAGKGLTWSEVAALPVGEGENATTCGDMFVQLLTDYRNQEQSGCDVSGLSCEERMSAACNRIDQCVGEWLPALISTSIIDGDAYAAAEARYLRGGSGAIDSEFDDVRFGYFGHPGDLEYAGEEIAGYSDAKSRKFLSLGQSSWREVLSLSPAEPGLSPARPFVDGNGVARVSAGGWSDLHPTRALRAMGCDQIVYITRAGEKESGFALSVAGLLGMDDGAEEGPERDALYSLENGESAFQQSIAEADAVWCTSWDDVESSPSSGLFEHAYSAPMEVRSAYFGDSEYDNKSPDLKTAGCSRRND